jgi:nucleoside-diphosphate-sugar epimerase
VAGYSGTPLVRKLGIKEGHRVALVDAPDGAEALLADLPPGVTLLRAARAPIDVVVWFVTERRVLERKLAPLAERLDRAGGLWICWPKKASGVATDMTENVARDAALALGLVDNKVCAVDDVWSGLRIVYRLRDR